MDDNHCIYCESDDALQVSFVEVEKGIVDNDVYVCEQCLREKSYFCDKHGPQVVYDNPGLLETIYAPQDNQSHIHATLSFCVGCIKEDLNSIDDNYEDYYIDLLQNGVSRHMLEQLFDWALEYLPDATTNKQAIGGVCFLASLYGISFEPMLTSLVIDDVEGSA